VLVPCLYGRRYQKCFFDGPGCMVVVRYQSIFALPVAFNRYWETKNLPRITCVSVR
jgi:hypothetical protein